MSERRDAYGTSSVDPDDAVELTDGDVTRADAHKAGRRVRRGGRPRAAETKASVTLRLDRDLLEALRASGDGWQTRVNETLRAAMRGETPQLAMNRAMRQAQEAYEDLRERRVAELQVMLREMADRLGEKPLSGRGTTG